MTDESKESVQVVSSMDFDEKIAKAANEIGVDQKTLVTALVENTVINAMCDDDKDGKKVLTLYSQDEWTKYVVKEVVELEQTGAVEEIKKAVAEGHGPRVH